VRCPEKHILRALTLISMLSMIRFSERSKNLAGIAGIARPKIQVADQRRMLRSSFFATLPVGSIYRLNKKAWFNKQIMLD
jgi:hypothetical protein